MDYDRAYANAPFIPDAMYFRPAGRGMPRRFALRSGSAPGPPFPMARKRATISTSSCRKPRREAF